MEFHPICLEYMLLPEIEFDALKKSIAQYGLDIPITLFKNVILDGRNRFLACREVGVEPHFESYEGNDPRGYVERRNDRRRHESEWVRASRAAKRANAPSGGQGTSTPTGVVTQAQAAADAGISVNSLQRAKKIRECGMPELIEQVDSGEISMFDGEVIASLAPEKQIKIIEQGTTSSSIKINTSGNDEWYTPVQYIDMAREVMGGIDLDPASCRQGQENVKAEKFYMREDNGLEQPWNGRVWLNPPYSVPLLDQFVQKMGDEFIAGNVAQAIVLTHSFTDTKWFHLLADISSQVCFTRGRIKFEGPDGVKNAPPSGHVFFYFGNNSNKFAEVFKKIGLVGKLS